MGILLSLLALELIKKIFNLSFNRKKIEFIPSSHTLWFELKNVTLKSIFNYWFKL